MAGWNPFKRKPKTKAVAPRHEAAPAPSSVVREARARAPEGSSFPHFNANASDQPGRGSGDPMNGIRSRLRVAFTPSQPVGDRKQFAGRDGLLKTVIRAIEDERLHIVLYGERGIGKTSLLHVLTQAAKDARYIVVYTSCGANSRFDETFRAAAAEISLLFHSGFSPTATETERGSTLADLLPEEPLTPRGFGDLCSKLIGTRVLIILDEFDRADSGPFRRDVAELIKNLSDRLGRVQLVLAGVAGDLTELVEHIPSIRRNIFALRVPRMTNEEILQIVAKGEHAAGLRFDDAAAGLVVTLAQGSPYLASLVCHHAGHSALDAGRKQVMKSDVIEAARQAELELEGRMATPVQALVRKLRNQGGSNAMVAAARTALARDGVFSGVDVESINKLSTKRANEIIDLLDSRGLIRVADQTAPAEARYMFVEDALPIVLWMNSVQENGGVDDIETSEAAPEAMTA